MGLDLGCVESVHSPASYFEPFRADGPIQWSEAQRGWAVIGHAAVADAFKEDRLLSADRITSLERVAADRPDDFGLVVRLLRGWMIFRDPPAHTRLREPVRAAFTPRRVADLRATISDVVDDRLDRLSRDQPVGLTQELALPVPALVIAALLGVDPTERERLQSWSNDLAYVVFTTSPRSTPPEPVARAARQFHEFFGTLVERARAAPTDGLISTIAHLETDLSHDELVGLCTLLLFAGHETTTTLIINALAILLEQPELADWLRADSHRLGPAIEEFLRVAGSARTMVRKVAADHEREGVQLRAGDNVYLSIAAANHDPAVFDHPEQLDLERQPNAHLGFGWGLHHCLGAALARAEAEVTIGRLLERFPEMRPAESIGLPAGNLLGFAARPLLVHLG